MNIDEFWVIVDSTWAEYQEDQLEKLHEQLVKRSDEDLIQFAKHYTDLLIEAYHWDLWAACFIIHDGYASDDVFEYFRDWLIAGGREFYHTVLKDPEVLAEYALPSHIEFEAFREVVGEVYDERHGTELAEEVSIYSMPGEPPTYDKPAGKPWTDEEAWERFPKLAERVRSSKRK